MSDRCIKLSDAISELMKMVEGHESDRFGGQLIHWTGIKAMLESLPDVQPECNEIVLPTINVLDGYDSIEDENGNCGFGVYDPKETTIYVAGDVPHEFFLKALFHELMHWVQDVTGNEFDEDDANAFAAQIYDILPSVQPDQSGEAAEMVEDAISRTEAIRLISGYKGVVDKSVAKRLLMQMEGNGRRSE